MKNRLIIGLLSLISLFAGCSSSLSNKSIYDMTQSELDAYYLRKWDEAGKARGSSYSPSSSNIQSYEPTASEYPNSGAPVRRGGSSGMYVMMTGGATWRGDSIAGTFPIPRPTSTPVWVPGTGWVYPPGVAYKPKVRQLYNGTRMGWRATIVP